MGNKSWVGSSCINTSGTIHMLTDLFFDNQNHSLFHVGNTNFSDPIWVVGCRIVK